jgi:hypothetical protein
VIRRRSRRRGRRTEVLAALAAASGGTLLAVEYGRVWRRGSAPLPAETSDLIRAGEVAAEETLAVIRQGYRTGSERENALLNMFLSFAVTFGVARAVAHSIRSGTRRPLRNLVIADRHIHHFVPGIVLALLAGGLSIGLRREALDKWLALPFGAGAALVLDESALLLELEDVYWTERGIVSVQITFGVAAALASLGLGVRLLRRGEPFVLGVGSPGTE